MMDFFASGQPVVLADFEVPNDTGKVKTERGLESWYDIGWM